MNNLLKVILVLCLLLIAIGSVLALLLIDTPSQKSPAVVPVSGQDKQTEATPPLRPSTTPTVHLLPPVPADVRAQPEPQNPAAQVFEAVDQPVSKPANLPLPPPENWKDWPVMPVVSDRARQIYQQGLEQGTNSHAFSILGDCQSQPYTFWGTYDTDEDLVTGLSPALQETVGQFSGSFDRYSPTVKDGTTTGAVLWAQWNDNKEKVCTFGETPLDCELRVHRPSIVLISLGTHWESRNVRYLTIILDKIIAAGAVPILSTKADNLELDERINREFAQLAASYQLPLWNFWATVQHLPNHGLDPKSDNMLLIEDGLEIRRSSGLEMLDAVWRGLNSEVK